MTEEVKEVIEEVKEESPTITPFSEEELAALAAKLEEDKDFDSDIARAVFTLMVVGFEYQSLYGTLQAYFTASQEACRDLAGACAQVIGLRDMKKIQKLYTLAGNYAGGIPLRATDILKGMDQKANEETTTNE